MLPQEFTDRMREMLAEEYPQFMESYKKNSCRSLRRNPLKGSKEHFLAEMPFHLTPVPWEKTGFYYEEEDQPGKHPFHEAGAYYIQEASAMFPAVCLDARPGERVLDLCAAPGGKSTQIAAAMEDRGLLVCNEIHPARAAVLSGNIERMGIGSGIVTNETPQALSLRFPGYFDRILVDAPCSGEGMFRRNPLSCEEWSPENVCLCAERQDQILDAASVMLRPGGRLVYSTCTFAPQENEGSVSRFMKRHPEFSLLDIKKLSGIRDGLPDSSERMFGIREGTPDFAKGTSGIREGTSDFAKGTSSIKEGIPDFAKGLSGFGEGIPEWVEEPAEGLEKTVRLWPHRIKGEGHFVAAFVKEEAGAQEAPFRKEREEKGLLDKQCREYMEFKAEYIRRPLQGVLLKRGDQLYLAPEKTPSLQGIRTLRPGLHLGTVKKDRLEPSHALALYLKPGEVKNRLSVSAEEARAWIGGQTLHKDGEKGWYLMETGGYALGFGKLSGGLMKNHYPRGLRKNL